MSTIVIMPGGFHPFHAGHAALYQSAVEAFPGAEVFVAATNDTSTRPFPFAIKEKLAKLAGVAPGHFVQVKSPFRAEEITSQFDPAKDRLIFVRSEKDADKPPQAGGVKKNGEPAYLQPLAGQTNIRPFKEHAYMAYLPTVEFGPGMTSATEIRTAWPQLNEKRKTALVMSLYPQTQQNPALAATVVKMLDTAIGEGSLNEFAPGNGGESGRWYTDDQMTELVGDGWWQDMDISGNIPKQQMIQQAQDWLDAQGYSVQVLNVKVNDDDCDWFIEGSLINPNFAKSKGQELSEFAPGDDSEGGEEDTFFKYAKMWYNGNLKVQDRIAEILDQAGWEIGELESEEGGTFIVRSGDENGNSYMSWSADELEEVSENQGWAATFTSEESGQMAGTPAIGGMWTGYQARENQPIDEKKSSYRDTELLRTKQFAKMHYPTYDADTAFEKWVQRSLKHSEQEDTQQDKILSRLTAKVDMLSKKLNSMQKDDYIEEKWSQKYKSSINCANPRGFSQRAHCAGRKKK